MPTTSWLRSNWLFLLIIAVGLFLRVIWVNDMEWKSDEQYMFSHAEETARTGHWDNVGMPSGGGIVNPGFSVAFFSVIAYFVHTPTGMDATVQWINIISILCFLLFILFNIEKEQRDIWLQGLTLAAVSPLAVIFSRKIWAQDVLPIFCFIIIWSNANRKKGWGAFLWGLTGALIGQIHMSGFYYAAGLFVFTIIYDYRNKQSFKWVYWLAGSVIGAIGLIPWVIYLHKNPQPAAIGWDQFYKFTFYINWFTDSHGFNTMYALRNDFKNFIKEPYIGTHATYGIGILHLLLVSTGIYTAKRIWEYIKRTYTYIKQKQLLNRLTINLNSTDFYLLALMVGFGGIVNFGGIFVRQPYLIVAFPFTYIFMAKIFQYKKKLFLGIIFAQLLLTTSFLIYIHTHDGAKDSDYGVTYRAQMRKGN